jgi:uncharacterized LabA/DUF88 family protein
LFLSASTAACWGPLPPSPAKQAPTRALAAAPMLEYSSIRPLVVWLDYNGYAMVTKPTKSFTDALGHRRVKGNMDIELTVDAMRLVEHLDHVVLFTGDGDFRALVGALQMRGRRVSVVSTLQTQPPMIADELRRYADRQTNSLTWRILKN